MNVSSLYASSFSGKIGGSSFGKGRGCAKPKLRGLGPTPPATVEELQVVNVEAAPRIRTHSLSFEPRVTQGLAEFGKFSSKPLLHFENGYTILPKDSNSSLKGQDVFAHLDEKRSLSKFFQTQEGYIQEPDAIGTSSQNKRKASFVDIGVQASSEINERTTPIKKRNLDFETFSPGRKPNLFIRRVKRVVKDFPCGVGLVYGDDDANVIRSTRLIAWKTKARFMDIIIHIKEDIVIEDEGSAIGVSVGGLTLLEEDGVPPPQEP
uniref:Uncharacterized protein n=1 Tax=Cannabis sativa TaxID=3483 RepID=A0A803NMC6_CANSA